MIHQLRIYEIFERNKAAFHARFRDHAARIMVRHGFEIVAMWETASAGRTEFAYVLAWPDDEARKAGWAAMMADAEWAEIKRVTSIEHGDLVGAIEDRIMTPTAYSQAVRERFFALAEEITGELERGHSAARQDAAADSEMA